MKKQEVSVKIRLLAFLALIPFTATTCWLPQSPEPVPQPFVPVTPGPAITTPAVNSLSFYVGDDYQPSKEDTGKTAYLLQGEDAPKDFVVTSEDLDEGNGVVRFLDGGTGTAVSVYFDEGEAFPSLFIVNEEGKEERVYGAFSLYNEEKETFSLTLKSGEEKQTFEGITLNQYVLSAYQDDSPLSDKQNERTRHYVTAVGVWTALVLQHDLLEAEAGNQSAVQTIANVGARVLTHADRIFGDTKTVTGNKAIEATVPVPVAVTVAVVSVTVATSVVLVEMSAENDEEAGHSKPSEPDPPEIRNAPQIRIWYDVDDKGEKLLIPVLRKNGDIPQSTEMFHIPPHKSGNYYDTSNVRFYFEIGKRSDADEDTDIPALSYRSLPYSLSDPEGHSPLYKQVTSAKSEGKEHEYYLEIKKSDGQLAEAGDGRITVLPIGVKDANADAENAVYPYFYVNGEEFSGEDAFLIYFLDYAGTERPIVLPYTITRQQTHTIPAPLVVPSQSELLKFDQAALMYSPFALPVW
jgi:hypothetical protein